MGWQPKKHSSQNSRLPKSHAEILAVLSKGGSIWRPNKSKQLSFWLCSADPDADARLVRCSTINDMAAAGLIEVDHTGATTDLCYRLPVRPMYDGVRRVR